MGCFAQKQQDGQRPTEEFHASCHCFVINAPKASRKMRVLIFLKDGVNALLLVSVLFWSLCLFRCFSRRRHEFNRKHGSLICNLPGHRPRRAVESIPGKVTLYIYMQSNFYKGSCIHGFFCFPWFFSQTKWEKKKKNQQED